MAVVAVDERQVDAAAFRDEAGKTLVGARLDVPEPGGAAVPLDELADQPVRCQIGVDADVGGEHVRQHHRGVSAASSRPRSLGDGGRSARYCSTPRPIAYDAPPAPSTSRGPAVNWFSRAPSTLAGSGWNCGFSCCQCLERVTA